MFHPPVSAAGKHDAKKMTTIKINEYIKFCVINSIWAKTSASVIAFLHMSKSPPIPHPFTHVNIV